MDDPRILFVQNLLKEDEAEVASIWFQTKSSFLLLQIKISCPEYHPFCEQSSKWSFWDDSFFSTWNSWTSRRDWSFSLNRLWSEMFLSIPLKIFDCSSKRFGWQKDCEDNHRTLLDWTIFLIQCNWLIFCNSYHNLKISGWESTKLLMQICNIFFLTLWCFLVVIHRK